MGSAPAAVTAGEWRSLPPIRRTAGSAPLVAPNEPFRDGLATTQPAPVALAPLGHERRLEAPAGLATGIASPVQRVPAEPLPSSVRRSESHRFPGGGRAGRTPRPDGTVDAWPSGSVLEADSDDVGPAALEPPPPGPGPLVTSPPMDPPPTGLVGTAAVSRAAAVQRLAPDRVPPADDGATTAAAAPAAAVTRPEVPGGTMAPISEAPLVARRIRLGPPVHPLTADAGGPRTTQATQRAAAPPREPVEASTGPLRAAGGAGPSWADTGAGSRGEGIPPVPGAPASAPAPVVPLRLPSVARISTAPLVGVLRPSVDTHGASPAPRSTSGPVTAEPADGSPSAALAALARVDPHGAAGRAPAPGDEGRPMGVPAGLAGIATRGAEPAPGSIASAAGGFAAGPTVARAADTGGTRPSETGTRLTWANPWLPAAASTTTAGGPDVAASTPERADPLTAMPTVAPPDAGGWAVAQASGRPPGGPFVPRPRGGRVGPAIQRHIDDPGNRRTGPEAPGTSTISSGDPVAGGTTGGPASSALPIVARLTDPGASPAESPPVQRAGAAAAAAEPVAGSAAADAAPGAPGSPTAEKDLDDLARRLYDRIGLRLRRDLLVERERAGALVDRGF